MKILADSNILIYLLNGNPLVAEKMHAYEGGDVAISAISYFEILIGIQKQDISFGNFKKWIGQFPVIPITADLAFFFDKIVASARMKKSRIPLNDMLIAATANHFKLPLLTNNKKDFEGIPGLKILSIDS